MRKSFNSSPATCETVRHRTRLRRSPSGNMPSFGRTSRPCGLPSYVFLATWRAQGGAPVRSGAVPITNAVALAHKAHSLAGPMFQAVAAAQFHAQFAAVTAVQHGSMVSSVRLFRSVCKRYAESNLLTSSSMGFRIGFSPREACVHPGHDLVMPAIVSSIVNADRL